MPQDIFPEIDPKGVEGMVSSVLGSAVFGLYYAVTKLLAGQPLRAREIVYVLVNISAATLCGALTAYIFAPILADIMPFAPLQDSSATGFLIGAALWELLPLLYAAMKRRARKTLAEDE